MKIILRPLFLAIFTTLLGGVAGACPNYLELERILGWPVAHKQEPFSNQGALLYLEDESERAAEIQSEEYRWLFEKLIPQDVRSSNPDESWKSFRVHLKDSFKNFPDPSFLKAENLNSYKNPTELSGKITYVGIVKKSYRMTVSSDREGLILAVRVHLQNATAKDMETFKEKMLFAENLWNQNRINLNFKYRFKFELVTTAAQAHFSVQVLDETRGPYDTYWGRDWTGTVIAHEIGHMLGLADEYKTISGEFDCLRGSLMCSAWYGFHMPHHYYFVLRRLMKTN